MRWELAVAALVVAAWAAGPACAQDGAAGLTGLPSHLGPSFPCPAPQDPLAQLICSSQELSKDDLRLVQAYQALRYQLDQAGKDALTREAIAFTAKVHAQCGIRASGSGLTAASATIPCVKQEYEKERALWARRLTGPAAEEAARPLREHVALQADLKALGFLPPGSPVDGVYGPETRAAIQRYQESQNSSATGFISNDTAATLVRQTANAITVKQLIPLAWNLDALIAPRRKQCLSNQLDAHLPGETQLISAKAHYVGGYRCDVDIVITDEKGNPLYHSFHWFGYEVGPGKGISRTLAAELVIIMHHPILVLTERVGPEPGSCGSCHGGFSTVLDFLVLRASQKPKSQRFTMSEENTLDYAVQPWGMQLAVGVKLACELCEIVTVTPYRFNPKSLQFEKSGDTTIDNSAYAKANHETITNYHLLRWPTWGPWRLYHQAPHICYLGAVSHHGAAVGFEVSPSQLAISVDNDIVHYQPDLEFFLHGGQLPSGLTAYIVPNPKPAGAFSGDLAPKIKFSNVVLSPLGRLTGLMPYYPPADAAEPPELTGLYRAMKLAAWYLIIDLDWNYETGAEYTHLIGMDISGSASALRQLRFCVANQ